MAAPTFGRQVLRPSQCVANPRDFKTGHQERRRKPIRRQLRDRSAFRAPIIAISEGLPSWSMFLWDHIPAQTVHS
jgi:hypothetical protein